MVCSLRGLAIARISAFGPGFMVHDFEGKLLLGGGLKRRSGLNLTAGLNWPRLAPAAR